MTDSYRATPPPAPPATEPSGANTPSQHPESLPPAPPQQAASEPEELTLDTLPKRSINEPQDASSSEQEQEADRQVWRPPVPQYPARPERQAPVQYEAPRVQQAPPQYAQQQYTPQQPSAPPAPQPQQPPQMYPQMQPQQPSYAATAPVTYMPPRPAMVVAPPAPRVSKVRMGRRMARRSVMGVSAAGKKIFGVRPGLMVAFLLVLVFSGWMAYDKWFTGSTPTATPNAPSSNGMIALPPEVASVQAYLTASGKDDPDGVWDTLSPAEKANRITNGEDKTVLAAVLDAEKQYSLAAKYRYVGGLGMNGSTDLSHGGFYFYVQDITSGTQQHSFPMFFSVDDQGKITTVNDQLYKLILQQLKGGN